MGRFDLNEIDTEEKRTSLDNIVNGDRLCDIPYLDMLREESRAEVRTFADDLFDRFNLISDVSEKKSATALEKCARPVLLQRYPWFRLCHIRDYLRFRTHLRLMDDFKTVLRYFSEMQDKGLISIVKIDYDKLKRPGIFGWRMVATDIRVRKTGLLVEHYMTFSDMISINEDWLHKVYETWRSRDTDDLSMPELTRMNRDVEFSRSSYRQLLNAGIISSTGAARPIAKTQKSADESLLRLLHTHLNLTP
ncbi:hypothetical protein [Sphingobium sp. YR768]|uniref:hypothetical protein n=1 Tax=Sphingobium sp. YR768 TaxID=1884365 RepID=UPI0008AFD582|nr:hypothetical protein [Sphingobium sp. YR768]SEQ82369.1 hypothetical protein SAMN05518866_1032 [Sphingobium sp. YR768]